MPSSVNGMMQVDGTRTRGTFSGLWKMGSLALPRSWPVEHNVLGFALVASAVFVMTLIVVKRLRTEQRGQLLVSEAENSEYSHLE